MSTETPTERRRRQNREYMRRLRSTAEGRARDKEYTDRWLSDPNNQEKIAEKKREHYLANRDDKLEANRRWRRRNPAKRLLHQTSSSARTRGLTHNLTVEQIEQLIAPMVCSVTGLALSMDWEGEGANPWGPSIDRIDNAQGYALGNVRLTAWAYNQARGSWDDEVLFKLAQSIIQSKRPGS